MTHTSAVLRGCGFLSRVLPTLVTSVLTRGPALLRTSWFGVTAWSVLHVNEFFRAWFALLVLIFLLADFTVSHGIPPYEIEQSRKLTLALVRRIVTFITAVGLAESFRHKFFQAFEVRLPLVLALLLLFSIIALVELALEYLLERRHFRCYRKSKLPLSNHGVDIVPPDGPYVLICRGKDCSIRIQILQEGTREILRDLGNVAGKLQTHLNPIAGGVIVVTGNHHPASRSCARLEIWQKSH
jgi:hypothetical protein